MKYQVDARGEACPKPVIMTKKQLDQIDQGIVVSIVDNEVAKENLSKLANSLGYDFSFELKEGNYYTTISKGKVDSESLQKKDEDLDNLTIGIGSTTMGSGNDELGQILMKSFIYTASETKPYPQAIVFFNEGVKLTCQGSKSLDDIKKLEEAGVEILSCGLCLDFLGIQDKLAVGSISNMYSIFEQLKDAEKNIIMG